jgi:hypothetical protein
MLGITLRRTVFALRVLRPIEREPVANQPLPKVNAVNRTYRNRTPVLVQADRRAIYRPSRYEGVEFVRCLGPATILNAKLTALGRVNAP